VAVEDDPRAEKEAQEGDADGLLVDEKDVEWLQARQRVEESSGLWQPCRCDDEKGQEKRLHDREQDCQWHLGVEALR
jgi:hypothetical protein